MRGNATATLRGWHVACSSFVQHAEVASLSREKSKITRAPPSIDARQKTSTGQILPGKLGSSLS